MISELFIDEFQAQKLVGMGSFNSAAMGLSILYQFILEVTNFLGLVNLPVSILSCIILK